MRRHGEIALTRTAPGGGDEALQLRGVDVVVTSMASFASAYVLLIGHWAPRANIAAAVFAVIAAGPPIFRWLARRYPHRGIFDFIASVWLMPSVIFAHGSLGPLVDAVNPRLADGYLARADLKLFGVHPSVVLGELVGPVVTELLMICYYSYFIGPFVLAMVLFFRGRRAEYEEYALALALFFSATFIFYVAVPAIGPRYYLAGVFDHPLQGLWLTPLLDGLMRTTSFARDCFPSGHTGVTLIMLVFAWRYRRPFFWVMLPVGMGLVLATLVGRFHYGIDLICAVPVVVATVRVAAAAMRRGEVVSERMLRAMRRLARV
ncbi:MAG: phosphatase PAP2 family protein [Myxococcaceae bacterium]